MLSNGFVGSFQRATHYHGIIAAQIGHFCYHAWHMKKNRLLILFIILLILILGLEAFLIYRDGGLERLFGGEQPTSTVVEPTTEPVTPTTPTEPSETPSEPASLLATQVFDVESTVVLPSGTQDLRWQETRLVTATPGATEKNLTVQTTSTREDDSPSSTRYQIKPDGTVTATYFESISAEGSMTCDANLPVYLPPGTDTAPASMNCNIAGGALNFSGTATAAPENDFTWTNGKTYKLRTITISEGGFTPGGDVNLAAGFEISFAPGIGTVEFKGSLGDLIFGQTFGPVSQDSLGQLISTDNDQIWLP